ncbi:MAG: hypothetical protein ACRD2J_11040 [Thermoanaerobaculia bacterium]
MRSFLAAVAILVCLEADAAEVARAGPYTFHSSFWVSLHQTLMHCATAKTPCDLAALTADERAEWEAAVETYRTTGEGQITFRRPMAITSDALTTVPDDEIAPEIREPLGPALRRAAPAYRRHFWPADDRANRFWIAYASAMVADAGAELAAAHERAYGLPWPQAIRIDAAPYAVPFGAYTMIGRSAGVHETVAARGDQGAGALETVVHEASHALVSPSEGPVADAIAKHAERLGIDPPRDLWHVILFATSSELTVRALSRRGIIDYTPMADDLLTRAWPEYRAAIEEHWIAWLDGAIGMDEAIGRIVEAIAVRDSGR